MPLPYFLRRRLRRHDGLGAARIEALAREHRRIVLTRGRALPPRKQLREVIERLDLTRSVQPFARCLAGNAMLTAIDKSAVLHGLPRNVRESHDRFTACTGCGPVYRQGPHWRRMRAIVEALAVDAA